MIQIKRVTSRSNASTCVRSVACRLPASCSLATMPPPGAFTATTPTGTLMTWDGSYFAHLTWENGTESRRSTTLDSPLNSPQMRNRSASPFVSWGATEVRLSPLLTLTSTYVFLTIMTRKQPFNNSFGSSSSNRNLVPVVSSIPVSAHKLVIRGDPSLLTCFDPADKELYDLWAPKS